jgi:isopenicillin N synthase-like dioxygenase
MPAATTPPPPPAVPFSVPTIGISPYLSSPNPDPNSPECLKIIAAVRTACTTTGFFQLVGHGVSKELQEHLFAGAEKLFQLPMEEKKKLDRGKSVGASNRGYELIGGQALQEGSLPDLKEVRIAIPHVILVKVKSM